MSQAIGSDRAGEVYRDRYGRAAGGDAWPGLFAATVAGVLGRSAHRLDQASRSEREARPRVASGPVPPWLQRGVRAADLWTRTAGASLPAPLGNVIGVLPADALLALLDESVPLPPHEGVDLSGVAAAAQRLLGLRTKYVELAFYQGVRGWFLTRHAEEPRASQMALLAGFAGLEQYKALEKPRRRWEDRIRDWRANTPAGFTDWTDGWRDTPHEVLDRLAADAAAAIAAFPLTQTT